MKKEEYKYLTQKNIDSCLNYIDKYWKKITVTNKKAKTITLPSTYKGSNRGKIIPLPYPYISPNNSIFNQLMFYWDSYFSVAGFLAEKKFDFARGIAENCFYLINNYGFVPVFNFSNRLTRSQPPFLSSLVKKIYSFSRNKEWLKKSIIFIEKEHKYWTTGAHITKIGLSRYYDKSGKHTGAELESGWDFTPRFLEKANNFCPIDLNSLIYKYERDLSEFYKILGNKKESSEWSKKAKKRQKLINKHLWNSKDGMFYDYDFLHKKQSPVKSVAAYATLWSRVATKQQAKLLVKNLRYFEYSGGLSCCPETYGFEKKQWSYPNGWAPCQLLVIRGLRKYGYNKDAKRITKKWLNLNLELFIKTKKMWEKYDVVNRKRGVDGTYKTQTGFGWTNSIFLALVKHELKLIK